MCRLMDGFAVDVFCKCGAMERYVECWDQSLPILCPTRPNNTKEDLTDGASLTS